MRLELTSKINLKIPKGLFEKLLKKGCAVVNCNTGGVLSLVFVNDEEIKKINSMYRGKDSATDVLSFSYLGEKFTAGDDCIGEIFISCDTAKRQAKEKKHSLQREMEILFVHGLLHVLGFTHETDRDEKLMNKMAKEILSAA